MWTFQNPVKIVFGAGSFAALPPLLASGPYAVVTYGEHMFTDLVARLAQHAGEPALVIDDVAPNPDCRRLAHQVARFADRPQVKTIVAIGGGSVIDSAKVFAAAGGNFANVMTYLSTGSGTEALTAIPLIAVPTTAGTGSEVTCWATVWDEAKGKKYSLAQPALYPTHAIVDPTLMLGKPRQLTLSTGLDALSHALESIWNVSVNPVSMTYAVAAAREILEVLPLVCERPTDMSLRSRMAQAALFSGLAFSNTKTALAHSLSYPLTLRHDVQHGIACSFTLPMILRSLHGVGGLTEQGLTAIFGSDLRAGAARLDAMFRQLGVSTDPSDYGADPAEWAALADAAFDGERGRNFIGDRGAFMRLAVSGREPVATP